jgi:hypothetical protein
MLFSFSPSGWFLPKHHAALVRSQRQLATNRRRRRLGDHDHFALMNSIAAKYSVASLSGRMRKYLCVVVNELWPISSGRTAEDIPALTVLVASECLSWCT